MLPPPLRTSSARSLVSCGLANLAQVERIAGGKRRALSRNRFSRVIGLAERRSTTALRRVRLRRDVRAAFDQELHGGRVPLVGCPHERRRSAQGLLGIDLGTRLDEDTRRTLARGERVREVLKQPQYATLPAAAQVVVLLAVTSGLFDALPRHRIADAEAAVQGAVKGGLPDAWLAIERGEPLTAEHRDAITRTAAAHLERFWGAGADADA